MVKTLKTWRLCQRQTIAELLDVKPATIDKWRKEYWIDGIHYHAYGQRGVTYYYEVCYHEYTHRGKREEHLRWVAINCAE